MAWQKKARFVIALFVVVFVAIVVVALRQRKAPPATAPISERRDKDCILENNSSGHVKATKDGKVVFGVVRSKCSYQDGRSKFGNGVEITSNRNGKPFTVVSREANTVQSGDELKTAHFVGSVKLTSEGTEVTSEEANYDQAEGKLTVPGAVAFKKGRMQGTGVGATYDFNREVIWMLTKPHITVAPDDKGKDAIDATAEAAGLGRVDLPEANSDLQHPRRGARYRRG
jgi:hypothetical protein